MSSLSETPLPQAPLSDMHPSSMSLGGGPAVAIVAEDGDGARLAVDAIGLAGGRVTSTCGWAEAAVRLAEHSGVRLVFADAAGIDDARLAIAVGEVAAAARAAQAALVVAMDEAQIDLVAGQLIDGETLLLCAPTMADRVGTLAVALASGDVPRLHDASRESARLDRLNEEVARISETLARLARRETNTAVSVPGLVGERTTPFGLPPRTEQEVNANEIRRTIRARQMRGEMFGQDGLFEDPAWDILLDLFAARIEHRQVSVSSLCIAAAVAPTTALRWIGKLIAAELLERRPDAFDRRRAFIVLTDRAAQAMASYVGAVKRAGLPLA